MYKSGRKHKDANSLPRNPLGSDASPFEGDVAAIARLDLSLERLHDSDIDRVRRKGLPENRYQLVDGILYKRNYDPPRKIWLPVIPNHFRREILQNFHEAPTAGHLGFMTEFVKDSIGQDSTEV